MFWVIRWTDRHTNQDKAIVVEARSSAEAEYMGLKRGLPIVFLGEASNRDVATAKKAKLLWRYTRVSPYNCFGRSVNRFEVLVLMMAGLATAFLHLKTVIPPQTF